MKNIEAIKTLIESMGITQEELYPDYDNWYGDGKGKYFSTQQAAEKWIASQKPKVPLLVTADGVEIYDEHQIIYEINKDDWRKDQDPVHAYIQLTSYEKNTWIPFSSVEARDEYIMENKPLFSIADMKKMEKESGYDSTYGGQIYMKWEIIKAEAINRIKTQS